MGITYCITVQELLDTGANISAVISQTHTHTVTSASGANLGPIGQWYLTFKLGKNASQTIL